MSISRESPKPNDDAMTTLDALLGGFSDERELQVREFRHLLAVARQLAAPGPAAWVDSERSGNAGEPDPPLPAAMYVSVREVCEMLATKDGRRISRQSVLAAINRGKLKAVYDADIGAYRVDRASAVQYKTVRDRRQAIGVGQSLSGDPVESD